MAKRARVVVALAGVIAGFGAVPAAEAKSVTIGSPGPASDYLVQLGTVATLVNAEIPGANVTAPEDGVITKWTIAGAAGDWFELQVVHPAGGSYTSPASTSFVLVPAGAVSTLKTKLPISAGDYVGIVPRDAFNRIGGRAPSQSSSLLFMPPLGSGPMSPSGSAPGEFGFNATMAGNCVVPKLKKKSLRAAKKRLKKAGCARPKVKGKGKRVKSQKPRAGKVIRGDKVVKLTLG
jgi:PASTA domain-containing protein